MKKIISIILLFTTLSLGLGAENTPEPYSDEEFVPVLHDVRRATVIFCGALPLGYMYSSIVSDNFLTDSDIYGGLEEESDKVEFKLLSSLAFAGLVTLIDLIIEKFFRR